MGCGDCRKKKINMYCVASGYTTPVRFMNGSTKRQKTSRGLQFFKFEDRTTNRTARKQFESQERQEKHLEKSVMLSKGLAMNLKTYNTPFVHMILN